MGKCRSFRVVRRLNFILFFVYLRICIWTGRVRTSWASWIICWKQLRSRLWIVARNVVPTLLRKFVIFGWLFADIYRSKGFWLLHGSFTRISSWSGSIWTFNHIWQFCFDWVGRLKKIGPFETAVWNLPLHLVVVALGSWNLFGLERICRILLDYVL